jgi:hypothetical protein
MNRKIIDKYQTAEYRESRDRKILTWDDDVLSRFWAKYSPPDANGCETWLDKPQGGYGRFRANGQYFQAHRAAAILRFGSVGYSYQEVTMHDVELKQAGLCAGPVCGVHVQLGSNTENRQAPDIAKLTRPQVEEIRTRYAAGDVSQQDLADEYGMSQQHISQIVNNERWAPTTR